MRTQRLSRLALIYIAGLALTVGVAACSQRTSASSAADVAAVADARSSALANNDLAVEVDSGTTTDPVVAAADDEAAPAPEPTNAETEAVPRPEGWGAESHSNDAAPNYAVVFPQDEVNQITITIAPEDWEAMQANMTELFGEPGEGGRGLGFPGGFAPPQGGDQRPPLGDGEFPGERPPVGEGELLEGFPPLGEGELPEGFVPPEGNPFGGGPGGRGFGGGFSAENPMWVRATIEFEGNVWAHVGVRYKGNSSLMSGWRSGSDKLPLKLDFDEFEDEYPEIDNQRFYGFKQLSLANGFSDSSFLRDAATYDILEEAGLPAAETAFYEIFLDHGEGAVSLGLYTVIEVVDDTVIDRIFGGDAGNIYEADGPAASFALGTADQIEGSFQKENNRNEADWSDIDALYDVLHSDQRTADPTTWRAELEALFDVDSFLEWLAISAVIQHWDTYGAMTHNYYLYNDPHSGQLTWISWDHNMAMSAGFGGGGGRGPGAGRSVTLDRDNVNDNWPLIRYLLDDPVYYDAYVTYIAETVEGPFNPDQMADVYLTMAELIEAYASADVGRENFEAAVQQLIEHAYQRAEEVQSFLDEQP